jgi:hypothetical protein
VQDKIQETRKSRQETVRIAHLDSGVDGDHEEIQRAITDGRIKWVRGFPESLDPLKDRNGHGTHGVSVILRTAPNSEVYIVRVVNDLGEIPESHYADVGRVLFPFLFLTYRRSCGQWSNV